MKNIFTINRRGTAVPQVKAGYIKGGTTIALGVDKNTVSNTLKRYGTKVHLDIKDKKPVSGVSSESAVLLY